MNTKMAIFAKMKHERHFHKNGHFSFFPTCHLFKLRQRTRLDTTHTIYAIGASMLAWYLSLSSTRHLWVIFLCLPRAFTLHF